MALKFDRKAFKAGVQIVKEPAPVVSNVQVQVKDAEGRPVVNEQGEPVMETKQVTTIGEKAYTFKTSDKGKTFEFLDEDYILSRYAALFTKVVA